MNLRTYRCCTFVPGSSRRQTYNPSMSLRICHCCRFGLEHSHDHCDSLGCFQHTDRSGKSVPANNRSCHDIQPAATNKCLPYRLGPEDNLHPWCSWAGASRTYHSGKTHPVHSLRLWCNQVGVAQLHRYRCCTPDLGHNLRSWCSQVVAVDCP